MLPYILKICGFKNSIVYTFYSMYQKYTCFVKLYICGLTYRLYIRYKHKLRIYVITYVPTLANDPPSAAVCLAVGTSYRVSQHPDIRTFYCTGTVYFAFVVDPRDPPFRTRGLDLWDRSLGSSVVL